MMPKVRFVKCPRCRNVLPESPDVPVYKCGACDTTLQAKHRKKAIYAEANLHEATDAGKALNMGSDFTEETNIPKDDLDKDSNENKESSELGKAVIISSSTEHSSELGDMKDLDKDSNENKESSELGEAVIISSSTEHSSELGDMKDLDKDSNENKESSELGEAVIISSSTEHSSELGNMKDQDQPTSCNENHDNGCLDELGDCNAERLDASSQQPSVSPELVEKGNGDDRKMVETSEFISEELGKGTNNGFNEEQEKSRPNAPHTRMMSSETFASADYNDPCSEFGSSVAGDLCRSPLTLRGYHRAYDGSVTSMDALEDQFHNRDRNRGKEHSRMEEENFVSTTKGLHYNKFASSDMFEMSRSQYGRRHDLPPRAPVYKRAPRFLYEDEGPSDQAGNSYFPHSSSYHPARSPEEFVEEEEKMRLLQIIYELEDQLKKSCNIDRLDRRKSRAGYYSHELPEEESLPGLNFHRHNPWARNFRSARSPFSAEMSRNSHQLDYSPRGYLPRGRQVSEPLPPPPYRNNSIHGTGRRSYYGPYSSWPSSPQQHLGSEFSTGSNDPSYELQKLRKYYHEKEDHLLKRHLRPIGKAAPFVRCYHCSEILHLPEDSLVYGKRNHRVRCGACSMVLKFHVENKTSELPYEAEARVPPPSVAEDYVNPVDMAEFYSASGADPEDLGSSPLHRLMGYSSVSQVFKGPLSAKGAASPARYESQ